MKLKLNRSVVVLFAGLFTVTLPLLSGSAGTARAPKQSGFLSSYHHLEKVDDTTSRSVTPSRLALYKEFQITAANCVVTQYDGKPLPAEAQRKVAEYLRQSVTKALVDRYPIVTTPGADVGEIRLAITRAYKTGNQLGLTIEGEIVDSYSAYQAAAVMRTELGKVYVGDWWDGPSAKEIIDAWSSRLRKAIDDVQGQTLKTRSKSSAAQSKPIGMQWWPRSCDSPKRRRMPFGLSITATAPRSRRSDEA